MPIIVSENGDISIYPSTSDAEKSLEAIDVKNNEFRVYDGDGKRLSLKLIPHSLVGPFGLSMGMIERVEIGGDFDVANKTETEPIAAEIKRFLSKQPFEVLGLDELSWDALVALLIAKLGYSSA